MPTRSDAGKTQSAEEKGFPNATPRVVEGWKNCLRSLVVGSFLGRFALALTGKKGKNSEESW